MLGVEKENGVYYENILFIISGLMSLDFLNS